MSMNTETDGDVSPFRERDDEGARTPAERESRELCLDADCNDILYGMLRLWQPKHGPRVNADTVLLAAFAAPWGRGASHYIELGCASGAVSLILARRHAFLRVEGVEIQPELVELARRNALQNGLAERTAFHLGDFRFPRAFAASSFDALVANPPYEALRSGQRNRLELRAAARHEIHGTLRDVIDAGAWLIRPGGRFFAIFKASRAIELFAGLRAARLEPKRARFVHPKPGNPASVVLVEAVRDAAPLLEVEPPLLIYDVTGAYTPAFLQAYSREGGLPCL
jgi:tRNA1(Val) A37 N6-methylase TrmN6